MANERLRPFRDYDEHDVLNLFAFSDAAVDFGVSSATPVQAGSVVKINNGWRNNHVTQDMIGDVGAAYNNTVSQRWGVKATVEYANGASSSEIPLGITLYDVREYDENGEALKFNPRKQDELQCSLSGQAVPIATKGVFLFATGAWATDPRLNAANAAVYATGAGQLTHTAGAGASANPKVGKALGTMDNDGSVLVKLEL
tara:strand:+ start:303 stop:902 length:600 start_codon:yes stop_codon:yes gene_type:complete